MRLRYLLGALLLAAPAAAHQETVAYSRMVLRESGDVEYALKIPVEDLAEVLGRQGHAALNAPEVRGAADALFRHFERLVGMTSGGTACPLERSGIEVPEDERLYGEMRFVFHCPAGAPVTFDYRVFFDVDPGHMGMLEVETAGGTARAELIVERPRWEVELTADGPPQVRPLASSAFLPLDKLKRPSAGAEPVAARPADRLPPAALARPQRQVAIAEEPAPPVARSPWMFIALSAVALATFLALLVLIKWRRPATQAIK